jgi:superfamily II DNA or RNA helicase
MTIRDERQREFADIWLTHGKFGILNLAPRFGKIRTTINILNEMKPNSVLIAYPDNKIMDSWKNEFEDMEYDDSNVVYTTFLSLKKQLGEKFDLVVIDEIHLLSEAQIEIAKEIIEINQHCLGLTGTLNSQSERTLSDELGLNVVANYSIEQAVEEGVIVDYQINVIKVPLDNLSKQDFKGNWITEKARFERLGWIINKLAAQGRDTMFMRLARMRVIQSSIAKRNATKELLHKYKDERILVFCGVTAIADALGIPSYHSKSSEKDVFNDFAEGKGNHLAVVKIGNTGVTYKPLNKVIINYFDSNAENLAQKINRCMAFEYNTPDKKAQIYIICSKEDVEQKWLDKALEFFDKTKIKYV